jgi:hypothetical protein
MSKRKRRAGKSKPVTQIEWLNNRTGYPSLEEREKIIELRQELSVELIRRAVLGIKPDDAQIHSLVRKYGAQEVERATRAFRESVDRASLVADDASTYRDYRLRFARFGEGLQFYSAREVDELYKNNMEQLAQSVLKRAGAKMPTPENDINRLLLIGWNDWKDLTPPAPPPRPADFDASEPASYSAPIDELLEWGDDLHRSHSFMNENEYMHWRKYIPALTRMGLDPALLGGWPSENPSWAPWHAIHALGALQAWESAPALAELADRDNDWLSDHLPHIWADMGPEVEPALWMILEDRSASAKQRGLAANSLYLMAEENDATHFKLVRGFDKLLGNVQIYNPTVNAYLIHFLRELDAVDEIFETVELAFEQGRVDLDIITAKDLDEDISDDIFEEDADTEEEE